ncbi:MAG: DUF192 domain-containing protein [Actinomycetota bacterium]
MKPTNAWLVAQGRVLASATVAESRSERRRGLIGERDPEFALVLPKCQWVHTIGMRCALDVAYLDDESRVVKMQHLAPMRLPMPVREARTVVEAKAGSFERWGLRVGDVVEVRRA